MLRPYGLWQMHRLEPSGKDTAPETLGKRLMAGFVLANGSMSSNQSGEKETWLPS